MVDDYTPIYQGDTGAPFNPIFRRGDGSLVNLAGATIAMKMKGVSADVDGTLITCAGAWSIASDPATGQASYAYTSADVTTPGTWMLYITITINGKPEHADTKLLQILPAP